MAQPANGWFAIQCRAMSMRRATQRLVGNSVIDKPFERCGAAGPAGEPTMQADRHHARRVSPTR